MKRLATKHLKWLLGVGLVALSCAGQSAVFHVLTGEICTEGIATDCKGMPEKCHVDGQTFRISGGELLPTRDSEVGFQNRLGQTIYKELEACVKISVETLGATPVAPETLEYVAKTLITGDKERVQGGKRLKPGKSSLASMPQGDVLLPANGITLQPREIPSKQVMRLRVTDSESGKSLLDISRPGPRIVLRARSLRPGRSHNWTIYTREGVFQGVFWILEPKDQKEVESEVRAVLKSSQAGPMGKRMMRAAVYHDYGLIFDRDRLLEEVRTMQQRR